MPYTISCELRAQVRSIVPPGLPELPQVALQIASPRSQQWPHNLAVHFSLVVFHHQSRMDPRQPPQPRPANHPQQHRLSLIIERVPSRDFV